MREQLPAVEREEVQPWVLPLVVIRTISGATGAASKQSRVWQAFWLTAVLAVTVLLALIDAPLIAYTIPFSVLFIATHTGLQAATTPRASRTRRGIPR